MITDEEIKRIAKLSMLDINPEQYDEIRADMGGIFKMVDQLKELKFDEDLDMQTVTEPHNVLRADEVRPSADREEMLKNAPKSRSGCFFVPQIVE